MKRNSHAQASMEFMTVLTFAFLLIIPLILVYVSQSQSAATDVSLSQAGSVARSIASAAQTVYAYGEPSSLTIRAVFPNGVENVSISGQLITFIIRGNSGLEETSEVTPFNLTGSLSNHSGLHNIRVTAANGTVAISEYS